MTNVVKRGVILHFGSYTKLRLPVAMRWNMYLSGYVEVLLILLLQPVWHLQSIAKISYSGYNVSTRVKDLSTSLDLLARYKTKSDLAHRTFIIEGLIISYLGKGSGMTCCLVVRQKEY